MAGTVKDYDGSVGMNSINFSGVDLISFGVVRPKDESDYEILTVQNPFRSVYKKLVLQDNIIKGIILVNAIDSAGVLLSLLSNKTDISAFKSDILSDNFNYGKIIGAGGKSSLHKYLYAGQISGR